jgi:hypothetical protein
VTTSPKPTIAEYEAICLQDLEDAEERVQQERSVFTMKMLQIQGLCGPRQKHMAKWTSTPPRLPVSEDLTQSIAAQTSDVDEEDGAMPDPDSG